MILSVPQCISISQVGHNIGETHLREEMDGQFECSIITVRRRWGNTQRTEDKTSIREHVLHQSDLPYCFGFIVRRRFSPMLIGLRKNSTPPTVRRFPNSPKAHHLRRLGNSEPIPIGDGNNSTQLWPNCRFHTPRPACIVWAGSFRDLRAIH